METLAEILPQALWPSQRLNVGAAPAPSAMLHSRPS
jgi:hypothetical protein